MQTVLKWFTGVGRPGPTPVACVFVLLALGLMIAPIWQARLGLAAHQHNVGHADKAAYAHRARSLVEGRGGRVPYITNFYRRHDPGIWRHDDHWPPFPAWILVPAFRLRGVDAAHARASMLAVGAVALPLAAAWLAIAATGQTCTGLAAAVLMLLPTAIMKESFEILGDVPLAAVTAAFGAAVLSSRRHPAWLLAAGLLAGCAALTKGSHVLLAPLLVAFAVLIHGPRILAHRHLLGGLLLFLILMTPGWRRNAHEFGTPLHSSQNHVAAFFGVATGSWGNWDRNFYAVHWDRHLPTLRDRYTDRALYRRSLRRNTEPYLRVALAGPDATRGDWDALGPAPAALRDWLVKDEPIRLAADARPWVNPPRDWPVPHFTLPGAAGLLVGALALALLGPAVVRVTLRRGLARWRRRPCGARLPPRFVNAVILATLVGVQAGFVIATWNTLHRFTFTILPPLYALGLLVPAMLLDAAGAPFHALAARRPRLQAAGCHLRWITTGLVCVLATALWVPGSAARAEQQRLEARIPIRDRPHYPGAYHVARWIEVNLPDDAVIMTRYPWQITFYCPPGVRAVGLPHATPDILFAVARYYNVTHLIHDRDRPGLRAFIDSGHPALTHVTDQPHPVYAIDYTAFAPGELADLDTLPPPATVQR